VLSLSLSLCYVPGLSKVPNYSAIRALRIWSGPINGLAWERTR